MKSIIVSVLTSVIVFIAGIFTYHFLTREKTGYVRIGVVLQKYQGMIDANKQFAAELEIVRSNADTLRNRYERLKQKEKDVKPGGKAEWGYQLGVSEKEYMDYSENADKQLQQRQQQLTSEVLNRINNYIQEYGKADGYKIIFGTTNDGSILYGRESDDLTDVIVSQLNEIYSSQKKNQAK
jgi:outer membrane protein